MKLTRESNYNLPNLTTAQIFLVGSGELVPKGGLERSLRLRAFNATLTRRLPNQCSSFNLSPCLSQTQGDITETEEHRFYVKI